jgi:hypothetical protein
MPNPAVSRFIPLLALALLVACNDASPATPPANATSFVPPEDRVATPVPGQTPDTPATAYIGKYPNDPVGGVLFFDRTDIAKALIDAVRENATRAHFGESKGPEKPIFAQGGKIVAAGCDAQDCSGVNWAFLFEPTTGTGEACYHDTATMQDSSRWFVRGTHSMRAGACPLA